MRFRTKLAGKFNCFKSSKAIPWVTLNPLSFIKNNSLILILKDCQLQTKNTERREYKNLLVKDFQNIVSL